MTLNKTALALSLAAVLTSASAAMAATTHHRGTVVHHRAAAARHAAYVRPYNTPNAHYYERDDNGSVWSFYPNYLPTDHDNDAN
jgi:hypothetical protein